MMRVKEVIVAKRQRRLKKQRVVVLYRRGDFEKHYV